MTNSVSDRPNERSYISSEGSVEAIAFVRTGPKMPFLETAINTIRPGAVTESHSPADAERYILVVSVCDYYRIGVDGRGPEALLGDLSDSQLLDLRGGRAHLILDFCNEGPSFYRPLFDAFLRQLQHLNIPRTHVTLISQNRRLASDYAEAYGSGGLSFRSIDYFPSTVVALFDAAIGNADFGSYAPMSGSEDKIFTSLNAAPRWHRILVFLWLKRNGWLPNGLVSFHGIGDANPKFNEIDVQHPPAELVDAFPDLLRDFVDDLPRTPLRFDGSTMVGNELATSIVVEAFERSLLSIVAESDFFVTAVRVTEKTFKTAAMGHPFIVVGRPDSVAFMRRLGFRTFDQLIDHSYDAMEDDVERMHACLRAIEACLRSIAADSAAWTAVAREDALFNARHARGGLRAQMDELVVSPLLAELAAFIQNGERPMSQVAKPQVSSEPGREGMPAAVASLTLLTPYEIDRPKIRIGPNADGGYILAGPLDPSQTVLSYGISNEYRFDEAMAERGHQVFMFDHTIGPLATRHSNMHFFEEGVAGTSDAAERVYSIADHLKRNKIAGAGLILKMDVEGVEFAALNALPLATLARFEQIVMEVHGINQVADDSFRIDFDRTFSRLNELFTLFHVHANNHDGAALSMVGGVPAVSMMELSYVRTDTVERRPNETLYPCALDYPCTRHPDKLLWFYPFLPTGIAPRAFAECVNRSTMLEQRVDVLKAKPDRRFDADWYRSEYSDLAECGDEYLRYHFFNHGIFEGRFGERAEKDEFERG